MKLRIEYFIIAALLLIVPFVIATYGESADISVIEPDDGIWKTSGTVTFGMVCEEGIEATQNGTVWVNDVAAMPTLSYITNQTNESVKNFSADYANVWNSSIGFPDGTHYYYAECNNDSTATGQSTTTAVRSIKVDSTIPVVYLQYPKSNETAGTYDLFNGTANSVGWDGESLTVYFNVTDANIAGCNVSSNTTSVSVGGITSQANTSATLKLAATTSSAGPATISVVCWDDAANVGATVTNASVGFDNVAPVITINATSPGIRNNQWETANNITEINISAVDNNLASCDLYVKNTTGTNLLFNRTISPTSDTVTTFDSIIYSPDNNTGLTYYVTCNDTYDHTVTSDTQTYFVDSASPGTVTLDFPTAGLVYVNSTLAFLINGSAETDLNYNHSTLYICKDSACSTSIVTSINFTGNASKITIPVNTTQTDMWYYNISNTDHAGQATGSINGTLMFITDSKYMTLNAGWSILAYVRHTAKATNTSVGDVYSELSATSKQVCRFNTSQNWECYAGVANIVQYDNFSDYEPIAIWVSAATDWGSPYYNNTSTFATEQAENYTFINATSTRWNLFCPGKEAGISLSDLNSTIKWNNSAASPTAIDGILSGMSLFNNSATANESKYVAYIPDWEWFAQNIVDYRAAVFGIQNATFFNQQDVTWVMNRSRL